MTKHEKIETGTLASSMESWRAALIAFWKGEGCYQRAENLGRGEPFDHADKQAVASLQAALERAPA